MVIVCKFHRTFLYSLPPAEAALRVQPDCLPYRAGRGTRHHRDPEDTGRKAWIHPRARTICSGLIRWRQWVHFLCQEVFVKMNVSSLVWPMILPNVPMVLNWNCQLNSKKGESIIILFCNRFFNYILSRVTQRPRFFPDQKCQKGQRIFSRNKYKTKH